MRISFLVIIVFVISLIRINTLLRNVTCSPKINKIYVDIMCLHKPMLYNPFLDSYQISYTEFLRLKFLNPKLLTYL